MRSRLISLSSWFFLAVAAAGLGMLAVHAPGPGVSAAPALPGGGQNPASQAPTAPGVIKAEANLVLVDVVAMDKKGNYITDLDQSEFKVYEDNQEQTISSYSKPSDPASAPSGSQRRFLVMFFDNSTMNASDQLRARQAATQFIDKTASSDRLMAVADFGGSFRIAQNFTADADRLKRAVGGLKFSAVQPNEPGQSAEVASLGMPTMLQVRSDFAARSMLLAIRDLAKSLRTVPGRKTLILFSGGFPLTTERTSELNATIDAANKANVAIYPIDVRGLQGLQGPSILTPEPGQGQPGFPTGPPGATLGDSPFPHVRGLWASLLFLPEPQRPGGGGGGGGGGTGGAGGGGAGGGRAGGGTGGGSTGGGTTGGGTRGGTGSTGGTTSGGRTGGTTTGGNPAGAGGARGGGGTGFNPNNSPYGSRFPIDRPIIPPLMENVATNQQVLYALAAGTGGFVIFNTNDFLAGLDKIAKELNEYYVLGYIPPDQAHDGSYHRIEVKVSRKGVTLRHRNGYYDIKGPDLLAGKPEGKALEERAAAAEAGNVPVTLSAPYFYTAPGVARVDLSMNIPGSAVEFAKEKGKFHSEINLLGLAYREDGFLAARFSDTVKLDLEKKEVKEFAKSSFPYRNSFNIGPGKYKLKVVVSAGGERFGKYETPLTVEPFDGKQLTVSGPALSDRIVPISQLTASLDAQLLEERPSLLFKGQEIIPSPSNRFTRGDRVALYVEVFEPALASTLPVRVGVLYSVINKATNQPAYSTNTLPLDELVQQGNPLIPAAFKVPVDQLPPGDYRLEVRARDSMGQASPVHSADFTVE